MAIASWILCCLICTTITDCKVIARLLWLGSPYEPIFECICRSEECTLSFKIKKLQHMILYSIPTISYAWYVIHINFHVVFKCILCWHCFMCVIGVQGSGFNDNFFWPTKDWQCWWISLNPLKLERVLMMTLQWYILAGGGTWPWSFALHWKASHYTHRYSLYCWDSCDDGNGKEIPPSLYDLFRV